MKLRVVMMVLAAGMLVSASQAQQEPAERGRAAGRHSRRPPERRGRSIFDRVRTELDLSADQQTQYDEIVAKYRKKRGGMNMKAMRDIMKEMREARRSGDDERVAELRKQMQESRKGNSLDAFFEELEPILNAEQREKLAKIRQDMSARRGRGRGPVAQLERLRGELKLSDEQAARYDELLDQLKEDLKSSSNNADTQEIIKQIREAAEAGDTERVHELRRRLPNQRKQHDRLVAAFLDEVEGFLEPGQKKTLNRFRQRMRASRGEAAVRSWFRYVRRLDLDKEQRQTLREIERSAAKSMRAGRKGRDAGVGAEDIKQQLREMLNDEQVAQFDRWLESQKSGDDARRPRRGRRGHRRPVQTQDDTP